MREFEVQITETLTKTVTVEAETQDLAKWIAEQNWRNGDYVLDADNFSGVVFESTSPVPEKNLRLKPGFKDGEIYDKFPDQVCYIPEYWNFDEDGPGITANDILEMCDGNKMKADVVFDLCEWAHPNTILLEWNDDMETMVEIHLMLTLYKMYQETGNSIFESAADNISFYREYTARTRELSIAIADMLEDADLAAIERLVYEGHDLGLVCDTFGRDVANFDENGKYLRNKEGTSQPLNQQIQNAARRAGEGANGTPPKDKER